jgi:hypothetical protein
MSDLYVMQNHLGLIKVGQSSNVDRRRSRIERDDLCHARIVTIAKDQGSKERLLLKRLASTQIIGEWHDGGDQTRLLITEFFRLKRLPWRFELAREAQIDSWLDRIELRRIMISREKLMQRFIKKMQNFYDASEENGSRFCDQKIGQIIYEYDEDRSYLTIPAANGNVLVFLDANEPGFPLPMYTSTIEGALQTFPAHKKPNHWESSAWDCCIHGLIARREAMIERHKERIAGWLAR